MEILTSISDETLLMKLQEYNLKKICRCCFNTEEDMKCLFKTYFENNNTKQIISEILSSFLQHSVIPFEFHIAYITKYIFILLSFNRLMILMNFHHCYASNAFGSWTL